MSIRSISTIGLRRWSKLTLNASSRPFSSISRHQNQQPPAGFGVGEIEGGQFRIEPLRRVGENMETTRARLVYQSGKRGILETDLLLSTFAQANLSRMSREQLDQYDRFLDENDWDIYYWATQDEQSTQNETSSSSSSSIPASPRPGEWAQTIGTFKAAYRPVPHRWSTEQPEILRLIRQHVRERSKQTGGVSISSASHAT